jgi:hypothetical protein
MNIVYVFKNNQGIGDNLRGLIAVLQVVQKVETKKEIQFHVDFSESHINKYVIHKLPDNLLQLKNSALSESESETKTESKTFYCRDDPHDKGSHDDMINYLLNTQSDIVYINSNFFPHIDEINEDIKTFIKNIFKFNEDFENVFNMHLIQLPKEFILFHYRFGDFMFHNNPIIYNHNRNDHNSNFDQFIQSYSEISRQNENYGALILSDSLNFKKKIYDIYNNNNTIVFLNRPTHTAYTNENDDINIFVDFFLVTKAKSIHCYSYYPWVSNFVLWNSYIYDIPLVNISPF